MLQTHTHAAAANNNNKQQTSPGMLIRGTSSCCTRKISVGCVKFCTFSAPRLRFLAHSTHARTQYGEIRACMACNKRALQMRGTRPDADATTGRGVFRLRFGAMDSGICMVIVRSRMFGIQSGKRCVARLCTGLVWSHIQYMVFQPADVKWTKKRVISAALHALI